MKKYTPDNENTGATNPNLKCIYSNMLAHVFTFTQIVFKNYIL